MYYYVYRISNIESDKHYYGCRKTKRNPKDDLGIRYFSSSRDKSFIELQKERPEIFKYVIVKTFDNYNDAISYECELHERCDVGINNKFYNKVKQTSTKFSTEGIPLSKDRRKGIGKFFKGRKQTEDHIEKRISKIKGEGNGMYGTSYYKKWIEKYGQEKANRMYEESLNNRIRGKNNPCYGKKGKKHPSSKIYILTYNGIDETFESSKDIIDKCNEISIKWNTLRKILNTDIIYKGYRLKSMKRPS